MVDQTKGKGHKNDKIIPGYMCTVLATSATIAQFFVKKFQFFLESANVYSPGSSGSGSQLVCYV